MKQRTTEALRNQVTDQPNTIHYNCERKFFIVAGSRVVPFPRIMTNFISLSILLLISSAIPCSFGIVCYEVVTGRYPFEDMNVGQVLRAVSEGRRPNVPEPRPSAELITLMEKCWNQDQAGRPDGFEPVVETLEQMQTQSGGDPRGKNDPGPPVPPEARPLPPSYVEVVRTSNEETTDPAKPWMASSGEL